MPAPHLGKVADRLVATLPAVGSISRKDAARSIYRYAGPLTDLQVEAILRIAVCRGQIIAERGGTTIRKAQPCA